jgi:hypothetical protein
VPSPRCDGWVTATRQYRYSSGIPALRSPAKKVFSNSVRIFGTPCHSCRSLRDSYGEQFLREAIVCEMGTNVDLRVCEHIDARLRAFGESGTWASEN